MDRAGQNRRGRLLIFAGAGASFAVDQERYPTTAGFFQQLPLEIRDHKLITRLSHHFDGKFGDATPDVEKVLWCLDELIDHLKATSDASSPISWLVPNNGLQELLKLGQPVNQYAAAAQQAIPKLKDLKDRINASLYDFYSSVPDPKQLDGNWSPLLLGLSKKGYWIDLVTTNYDLVLESAARATSLEIGSGRTDALVPELDSELWRKATFEDASVPYKHGLITKLHGSLNWEWSRKGRIAFGGTTYKSRHEHHAVIYPGFKGVPRDEPFASLHDYFEAGLRNADVIIFIGFAFRDDHINDRIERGARDRQVFSINPAGSKLPSGISQSCTYMNVPFDNKSVEEVLGILPDIAS